MAIWTTSLVWVVGTLAMAIVVGQTPARAAAVAALTSLDGLIAWIIYHAISRRNDGLLLIMMPVLGLGARCHAALPLKEELARWAVSVVVWASVSFGLGLYLRDRPKGRGRPSSSSFPGCRYRSSILRKTSTVGTARL